MGRAALTLQRIVQIYLSAWEALRRLGFASDYIFITCFGGQVGARLAVPGRPTFDITFTDAPRVTDSVEFARVAKAEMERWKNGMTNAERDSIYRRDMSKEKLASLVEAILNKGIAVPAFPLRAPRFTN